MNMARAGLSPALIVSTIRSATSVNFDVSPNSLVELKRSGVWDTAIEAMIARARPREKSERLGAAKPNETILRDFKTLGVRAWDAEFFDVQAIQAIMGKNKDFRALNIVVVDDHTVADVILEISYTFPFDYPFTLKYQNSSVVLLSGKGTGAFSGQAGATSVVTELTKALKPYRQDPPPQPTAANR
jgi:hypothetical protein